MKICVLVAASTCLACQSLAQAPLDAPIVFDQEFFQRFVPQTALDMVERVPGFSLDQGENRRGLAGAAGNVLIDGRVPVVKGQSIRGFLRRIPAATVQRVELIRGSGTSASNAQSVRLNIIRVAAGGSGVWRATVDYTEDDRVSPSVDASWTGRVGQLEYRLSGDYRKWHDAEKGAEVSLDAFNTLEERVREQRVRDDDRFGISGEMSAPIGGGAFTLVGGFEMESGETGELAEVFTPQNQRDGLELVQAETEGESAELSATYSQSFSGWNSELSALVLSQQTKGQQISFDFAAGDVFEQRTDEFETSEEMEIVLRAVASRRESKGAWTFEGEMAFNKLDQSLRLTENDGAGPIQVALPGANTIVEELRGEYGATRAWEFGPKWSIETGIAYEISRLSNEGDFSDERDLSFWKPSLQVTRKINDDDQIRFRLFRDVDQLDFEDFAASVELDNDDVNAGNADLRPETSWRAELSGDWRFGKRALEVSLYAWDVEDTQDFALIETETDRFDTQGNIGDGTVYGLNTRIETPIEWVPGSILVFGGNWQDSEVTDPLTGETRQQSEISETSFEVEFRQDIEALSLAWGIEFETETQAPQFRFDRITKNQNRDRTRVWVETTALGNFKLSLSIDNFTGALETRDRRRFDPDRLSLLNRLEQRERDPGMSARLRLQGTF